MPFIAEIRQFAFNFPPRGWASCDGQFLSINTNQALFAILGTTYGGNGQTTFALPNLQGRTPRHPDMGAPLGQQAGSEGHWLSTAEMPAHDHQLAVSKATAVDEAAQGKVPAAGPGEAYGPGPTVAMQEGRCSVAGAGQPHENRQPYSVLNHCIALQGAFPPRDGPPPGSGVTDPFVGEVRMFAGNFAPAGWAFCDGSYLGIAQNSALFTLIGTTYGGDGAQTFALPDLRSRIPVHRAPGTYVAGQMGGVEAVALRPEHLPAHSHPLLGTDARAVDRTPGGLSASTAGATYVRDPVAWGTGRIPSESVGQGLAHDNMAPSLALSFIIALEGIYPSPN